MKFPAINWLNTKYKYLLDESAKKGIWRSLSENFYEYRNRKKFRKFGVIHPDTCLNLDLTKSKSVNKDSNENQPSSFYSLHKAFKALKFKASNITLLDMGCGSGRVLSFGMYLKFKEVFGVDLDEPALEKATDNCEKMQTSGYKSPFHIYYKDACDFVIPENVNVIYLFNPFGEKTMKKVASDISRYANDRQTEVFVVYTNPVFQDLFFRINKKATKIFESFLKSKKPDIAIIKLSPLGDDQT